MPYFLSEEDAAKLKELFTDYRLRRVREAGRGGDWIDHEEHTTPDVYVARTPENGIPALDTNTTGTGTTALSDDVPGYAECDIYRILHPVGLDPEIKPLEETTKRVYNISTDAILGNIWILICRDKFGHWIATPPSSASFLARITSVTYGAGGGYNLYNWERVIDNTSPTPLTYSSESLSGTAYQEDNITIPVPSIVRIRRGNGNYYLIDQLPWIDLFRRTALSDAYGVIGYERIWNQNTQAWMDGREVRIVPAG